MASLLSKRLRMPDLAVQKDPLNSRPSNPFGGNISGAAARTLSLVSFVMRTAAKLK